MISVIPLPIWDSEQAIKDSVVTIETVLSLWKLLIDHILKEDMKYAKSTKERKGSTLGAPVKTGEK
jgi:hemerythrin